MKTIVVGTDFSEAANNACAFAYELAKSFNARLIIYSAYYEVPIAFPEMPVIATPEDMHAFVEQQLEQAVKQLNITPGINVETICSERPATNGIIEIAKEKQADLLVTGMKGAGKGFRKVFGSTVSSLINKTKIPLIVVPENKKYTSINTIALANENDVTPGTDDHLLAPLRDVVEKFNSKLYLVRVSSNKIREAFAILYSPSTIKRMIKDLNPEYESIEGKDITEALNDFIEEYQVDMLAMLSHHHSLLSRWLGGSTTQKMIFETEIPLLVIPVEK